jgi:hypothetical protein
VASRRDHPDRVVAQPREGLGSGYWRFPRWLGDEVADGNLTLVEIGIVVLVGSRREAEPGRAGWSTSLDHLVAILTTPRRPVSQRTVRRAMKRLQEFQLVESDLRSGVTTFRCWLGSRLLDGRGNGRSIAEVEEDAPTSGRGSDDPQAARLGDLPPAEDSSMAEVPEAPETGDGDGRQHQKDVFAARSDLSPSTMVEGRGRRRVADADVFDLVTRAQVERTAAGDGDDSLEVAHPQSSAVVAEGRVVPEEVVAFMRANGMLQDGSGEST